MTSQVLVIGGNGFIGSHVVDCLVDAGVDVSVMTLSDRRPQWNEGIPVRRVFGNLLNVSDVARAVDGHDVVVHLVSSTDPASAKEDPTIDIRTNLEASVRLFDACRLAGVERVVFGSSGGTVYGPQSEHRPSAEWDLPAPISPYGIGKLAIENYLNYFRVQHGLNSTVARISNPYGTRQRREKRQGLIPISLRCVADGHPLKLLGDGSMVRDYLYVADLARMLTTLTLAPVLQHDVYNLGSGAGHTVMEVVEVMREVTGESPELQFAPQPPTFVDYAVLDVGRYTREFGSPAGTSLHDGIAALWHEMQC